MTTTRFESREHPFGVVVIGRNEGERLHRCLESRPPGACVYVDSGSTDESVAWAESVGCEVVKLDMTIPFTAARARNEGFMQITKSHPELENIFFMDGDCEAFTNWPGVAAEFLGAHPDVSAVCGRRRERYPERTIFNRLCDIEWNTPIGEARAFGGDVVIRASALRKVGGYRDDLIAGEEPELCVRLRAAGGRIWRLDHDMTWHDAAITRWRQWWMRSMRAGHAFAEGCSIHGQSSERFYLAETRRALLWGLALPLVVLLLGAVQGRLALLWLVYPLQWARIALQLSRRGQPLAPVQAAFFLLGRFPEAVGAMRFFWGALTRRRSRIIEYK